MDCGRSPSTLSVLDRGRDQSADASALHLAAPPRQESCLGLVETPETPFGLEGSGFVPECNQPQSTDAWEHGSTERSRAAPPFRGLDAGRSGPNRPRLRLGSTLSGRFARSVAGS